MSATCNGVECCDTSPLQTTSITPVAPTVYQNEEQCATVECPEGETGDPVTSCIAAGTAAYNSYISVADANAKALAAAQAAASAALSCTEVTTYYSTQEACVDCPNSGVTDNLVPSMTSNSSPSGTVTADSQLASAYYAFSNTGYDADYGAPWLTAGAFPHWLNYEFDDAQTVTRYRIRALFRENGAGPRDFELQGSNDGINYDTLDTQTDYEMYPSMIGEFVGIIASPAAYTHYRLYVTDASYSHGSVDPWLQIYRVYLDGDTTGQVCAEASATSTESQAAADAAAAAAAMVLAQAEADTNCAVAGSLNGLRWELPCNESGYCALTTSDSATMGGSVGTNYDVTIRIRGVVEIKSVLGGSQFASTYCNMDGTPDNASFATVNEYSLVTSSPAHTYWLNAFYLGGETGVIDVDYTVTITIAAGATVTLLADSKDGVEGLNPSLTVPDIYPYPDYFRGQFLQMDVTNVAVAS